MVQQQCAPFCRLQVTAVGKQNGVVVDHSHLRFRPVAAGAGLEELFALLGMGEVVDDTVESANSGMLGPIVPEPAAGVQVTGLVEPVLWCGHAAGRGVYDPGAVAGRARGDPRRICHPDVPAALGKCSGSGCTGQPGADDQRVPGAVAGRSPATRGVPLQPVALAPETRHSLDFETGLGQRATDVSGCRVSCQRGPGARSIGQQRKQLRAPQRRVAVWGEAVQKPGVHPARLVQPHLFGVPEHHRQVNIGGQAQAMEAGRKRRILLAQAGSQRCQRRPCAQCPSQVAGCERMKFCRQ